MPNYLITATTTTTTIQTFVSLVMWNFTYLFDFLIVRESASVSRWCGRGRGIGFVPGRATVANVVGGRNAAASRGAGGVGRAGYLARPAVYRHPATEVTFVSPRWQLSVVVSTLASVNVVNQHQVRLLLQLNSTQLKFNRNGSLKG